MFPTLQQNIDGHTVEGHRDSETSCEKMADKTQDYLEARDNRNANLTI